MTPLDAQNSVITFEHFTNLSLIGYSNVTIDCNFFGSVNFKYCSNVTIENIRWIRCGSNTDSKGILADSHDHHYIFNFDNNFFFVYKFGIKVDSCTNVYLKNCTFVASMVGLFAVSDAININQVHFFSVAYPIIADGYLCPGCYTATGLVISHNKMIKSNSVYVNVTNSLFSTLDNKGLLLFYILSNNSYITMNIFVKNTNFTNASFDPGWVARNGIIWMRLSCQVRITFNGVKFASNNFSQLNNRPAAILSIAVDHSAIKSYFKISRVKIESCTFLNNAIKGVVNLNGDVEYFGIIDTYFSNIEANSILSVKTSSAVTTTMEILQSAFLNNIGGQLLSLDGTYILLNMTELQIKNNTLLPQYNSLLLFQNYTVLAASLNKVNYKFNHINGRGTGFYFAHKSIVKGLIHPLFHVEHRFICFPPGIVFDYFYCVGDDQLNHLLLLTNSSFNNNIGGDHGAAFNLNVNIPQNEPATFNITINTCAFNNNSGYKSLIYSSSNLPIAVQFIVKDSIFMHNEETVFYILNQVLQFHNDKKVTIFDNNRAQNGAALYLDLDSKLIFNNNSAVSFSNNVARRYGACIYFSITQSSNACNENVSVFTLGENITSLHMDIINNVAGIAGNSIYFSISQSCNNIFLYDEKFSLILNQTVGEVTTSPNMLKLYFPAHLVNKSDLNTYYIKDIMLGQNIVIPACALDHFEMPTGTVQFIVQLFGNNDQNFYI